MIDKQLWLDLETKLQNSPQDFFEYFGGLHDSEVLALNLNIVNQTCQIVIDDLYANYLDLPEYQDIKNVMLTVHVSKQCDFNLDYTVNEIISIYDIEITQNEMKISFSPSGYLLTNFDKITLSKMIE